MPDTQPRLMVSFSRNSRLQGLQPAGAQLTNQQRHLPRPDLAIALAGRGRFWIVLVCVLIFLGGFYFRKQITSKLTAYTSKARSVLQTASDRHPSDATSPKRQTARSKIQSCALKTSGSMVNRAKAECLLRTLPDMRERARPVQRIVPQFGTCHYAQLKDASETAL